MTEQSTVTSWATVVAAIDGDNVLMNWNWAQKEKPTFSRDPQAPLRAIQRALAPFSCSRRSALYLPISWGQIEHRMARYVNRLFELPLDVRWVEDGDQAVDQQIIYDLTNHRYPEILLLFTGDAGYIPLLNAMKRHGTHITVISARRSISAHYFHTSFDLMFLDDLIG
jgi:hypothetical protein